MGLRPTQPPENAKAAPVTAGLSGLFSTEPFKSRTIVVFAVIAILAVYAALRIPGLGVPLDRDEGAFGHMGQMIRQGGLPYRDGLDHKPPVAFYINALALEFVPSTARGIHSFLLVYNLLTLLCLFALARMYFRSLAAGLWCGLSYAVVSASPDLQGFSASTEMWALLPISASLLAAVAAIRCRRPWLLAASGALGALACWTKQTMFSSIAFVLLYAVLAATPDLRRAARNTGLWMAGAFVVSGGFVWYFWAHGALHDFIYWCFTYGLSYAKQVSLSDVAGDFRDGLWDVFRSNFIIFGVGIGIAAWTLARSFSRERRGASDWHWPAFVLGFFILSLAGTVPGFAYNHYFAQLAPAAALAAGEGFRILTERRMSAAVVCLAVMVSTPVLVDRGYFFERDPNVISRTVFEDNPFPESKPIADYIDEHSRASDLVFIEGSEPQILFYAERRSPTAFLMIYPLMTTHPQYKQFQYQMMRELTARPPKYIIAPVNVPNTLAWDEEAEPQIVDFLTKLIARDYVLERSILIMGRCGEWIEPGTKPSDPDAPLISIFRRKQ